MPAELLVEFHPAGPEHTDLILSLMRALEDDDPNKKRFDEQARRSSYARFLAQPSYGRLWLFEAEHTVVGYMILTFVFSFEYGGRNAFIDELYVLPGYRGRGVGRRALKFAEKFAREEDIAVLHLEVSRTNPRAHKLYSRAGYANHDRYLLTKWLDDDKKPA
jgi:GNAT superfamily N-acetyltransferase